MKIMTPIQTYEHPEFHDRALLIGMIHMGRPDYYEHIQAFVDEHEKNGAAVHYELVGFADSKAVQSVSHINRLKLHLEQEFDGMLGDFGRAIFQGDNASVFDAGVDHVSQAALTYRQSWENHDTDDLDIARHQKLVALLGRYAVMRLVKLAMHSRSVRSAIEETARRTLLELPSADQDKAEKPSPLDPSSVLIDYRNEIALTALDRHFERTPGSELVLIWGVGHLAGIGAGLVERGFELVDTQEVHAADSAQ